MSTKSDIEFCVLFVAVFMLAGWLFNEIVKLIGTAFERPVKNTPRVIPAPETVSKATQDAIDALFKR